MCLRKPLPQRCPPQEGGDSVHPDRCQEDAHEGQSLGMCPQTLASRTMELPPAPEAKSQSQRSPDETEKKATAIAHEYGGGGPVEKQKPQGSTGADSADERHGAPLRAAEDGEADKDEHAHPRHQSVGPVHEVNEVGEGRQPQGLEEEREDREGPVFAESWHEHLLSQIERKQSATQLTRVFQAWRETTRAQVVGQAG